MVSIRKNSNKLAYGLKHYILDEYTDFEELKLRYLKPGSTAFVIATSKNYILNTEYEWIEIKTAVVSGGTGSGGNDGADDDGNVDGGGSGDGSGENDYDGGSIDGSDPVDGDGYADYDGGSIDGSDPG